MKTTSSPVKVFSETKEQIKYAATVMDRSQAEILQIAMNEFVDRHKKDFQLGLQRAGKALLSGDIEAVAYLLDEDPEKVRRVAGKRSRAAKKG